MVTLQQMRDSNAQIERLPPGLVAVFVGATRGLGEATMKQFARHAKQPRIYFIGRNCWAGNKIARELEQLNPSGQYLYIRADVSLLRVVDKVCLEIRRRENAVNLLFLNTSTMQDKTKTDEGLPYQLAVMYFSRLRFITNLSSLLYSATGLRRVVSIFAGAREGWVYRSHWADEGRELHMSSSPCSLHAIPHYSSLMTLALEACAKRAADEHLRAGLGNGLVSFVHTDPGEIPKNYWSDIPGVRATVLRMICRTVMWVMKNDLKLPMEEAGERQLFFATSRRFAPKEGSKDEHEGDGVPLVEGVTVAKGTDGIIGSGVYSVDVEGETSERTVSELSELKRGRFAPLVWEQVEREFVAITGGTFDMNT
ncbi:uncharacterized protein CTHT_0035780 [Thermochaetoides thermophila DSM 1495]|uniref:Uncharacterized protein n=1 Tax=Chaetomium thermophilum (strain DSM 1495 / CBS 144.50 / IMI 039719) TaxID=759272 RepID=G0S713_CHATD|nr:hypothetical protein CTHT_0035780 [Thermochaetoides thermophila DSM 1495]EGS21711.1 hypothetical protein CTHT_0035780 [Thermochaetoides thermophila DSM 1495]